MPDSIISSIEELDTIDAQTDADLTFEDRSQNLFKNKDDSDPIEVDANTGVGNEGAVNPETGIGIEIPAVVMEYIPGVEMEDIAIPGAENATPGVEAPPIETPGVDNLDVVVKVEIPPEDTNTVKPTGVEKSETTIVTEHNKATDPQDTEEDHTSTKPLVSKGKWETPDKGIPHLSALMPSTQAVYGMDCLRKNRKRDYSYRFSAVMHHTMMQVSLNQGLKHFKEKGEKATPKELLQLHMKSTLRPHTAGDLSNKEKDAAL